MKQAKFGLRIINRQPRAPQPFGDGFEAEFKVNNQRRHMRVPPHNEVIVGKIGKIMQIKKGRDINSIELTITFN